MEYYKYIATSTFQGKKYVDIFYAHSWEDAKIVVESWEADMNAITLEKTEEHVPESHVCDECRALLHRSGMRIWCENGCIDDDIRNDYAEDELEEFGIKDEFYPPNEEA